MTKKWRRGNRSNRIRGRREEEEEEGTDGCEQEAEVNKFVEEGIDQSKTTDTNVIAHQYRYALIVFAQVSSETLNKSRFSCGNSAVFSILFRRLAK
jgi:hypothetical protein